MQGTSPFHSTRLEALVSWQRERDIPMLNHSQLYICFSFSNTININLYQSQLSSFCYLAGWKERNQERILGPITY